MSEFQHTYSGGETQCTHCRAPWRGENLVTECPTLLRAEVEQLRELLINAGWPALAIAELGAKSTIYERAAVVAAIQAAGISVIPTQLADHGIRVRISMRDWSGTNRYDADAAVTTLIGNAPADLTALVAEVERLRSINDEYLLNMGRQHAKLREQAHDAAKERAAVVAFLREQALQSHPDTAEWFTLNTASVMIERGEHRRREENP
jgi:hypothetical protein